MRGLLLCCALLCAVRSVVAGGVPRGQATGYWHAERLDGKWWAVRPDGEADVLRSIEHFSYRGHPTKDPKEHYPYGEGNAVRYPSEEAWASNALGRVRAWGFNSLGIGAREFRHRGFAFTEICWLGRGFIWKFGGAKGMTTQKEAFSSVFPNVFDPEFPSFCRVAAEKSCGPLKDERDLVGYFLDNELPWWGRGDRATGMFDLVASLPPEHSARQALEAFVAAHGGNRTAETKIEFLRFVADRFFSVATAAIRAADPNHMILGCRFAGTAGAHPVVWDVCAKYCDAVSLTFYPWADLDNGVLYDNNQRTRRRVWDVFDDLGGRLKRPLLVAEWSFAAVDSRLPCARGTGMVLDTQEERAQAGWLFLRTALAHPDFIGFDYFMWVDWPAKGAPEDFNYGLVSVEDKPYETYVGMFAKMNARAVALHAEGTCPKPRRLVQPLPPVKSVTEVLGRCATPVRRGNDYSISNACGVRLAGRVGEPRMLSSVTWDDSDYGNYTAIICAMESRMPKYVGVERVTSVRTFRSGGVSGLDISATARAGRVSYDIVHRVLLSADRPEIGYEIVSLTNTGSEPLELRTLYSIASPPFCGIWGVRRTRPLWRWRNVPCDRWTDGSRFLEMSAPRGAKADVAFWTDKGADGRARGHSDAMYFFGDPPVIQPGKTFVPESPAYFICTLGRGKR